MNIIINKEICHNCKICINNCPSLAIDLENQIIKNSCIECGHCISICPFGAISDNHIIGEEKVTTTISEEQMLDLFQKNRSYRKFSQQNIENEKYEKLIDTMKLYPSASNMRTVEVTAIIGFQKVSELNKLVANSLYAYFSKFANPLIYNILKLFIRKDDAEKLKFYKSSFEKKFEVRPEFICFGAPLVLLFHAPKQLMGMPQADSYIWATQTSNLAISMKLATCFNGFIVTAMHNSKKLRKFYGIPNNHVVHSALLIGYPDITFRRNIVGRQAPNVTIVK